MQQITEELWQSTKNLALKKRGLGLQPVTTLVQVTHYTSPNYTNHPKWIYTEYTVLKIFFTSGFLSILRLPWKTEFSLKIFTVLNIVLTIQDFWATLRLPWKTEFALKLFTVFNILFTFRIFEQPALALNSLYWIYIFYSEWRAVRFVNGEALSLSKPNLRVYEFNLE